MGNLRRVFWAPCLGVAVLAAGCDRGEKEVREVRRDVFGTSGIETEITVVHADGAKAKAAVERAFAAMREAAAPLNVEDPGREISRLNAAAGKPVKVGAGLRAVLARSLEISKETDGAFDVTVGPLVNLWKPFIKGERKEPPSKEALAEARARVGWKRVRLEGDVATLEPGTVVDLGGIAKGYVADAGLASLRSEGIARAAVNANGHIAVLGLSSSGRAWRFGIQVPGASHGRYERVEEIASGGMATSGDYEQFVDYGGRRCHHILDPRTGEPSASGLASATVFAANAADADALATAMVVLGAEKGRRVLARLSARGLFLGSDGGEVRAEAAPAAAKGWLPVALASSEGTGSPAGAAGGGEGLRVFGVPLLLLGILGVAFGIGLAFASRVFFIQEDPKVVRITAILPGANCGGCGFPGCGGYARALVHGSAPLQNCNPGGESTVKKVAEVLGVEAVAMEKRVAILHCHGRAVKRPFAYAGVETCLAASLVQGGPLACPFGCLRYGDCAAACPFGAISMESGFPEVDESKCTACRNCVAACPRGLFEVVPAERMFHVACRSHERGKAVTSVCAAGCIGCGRCARECPEKAIRMDDFLSVIDYAKCRDCGKCAKVCPTKAIEDFRARRGVSVPPPAEPAATGAAGGVA